MSRQPLSFIPSAARRQKGITMLHILAALLVIAIITQGMVRYQLRHLSEVQGKLIGGQAGTIRIAVDDYLKSWGAKIVSGGAVSSNGVTVANPLAPTLAELSALGHLHATVSPTPPNGGSWVIVIEPYPSTCTLPGACNLASSVYATNPLVPSSDPTKIDSPALYAAVAEIGNNGGFSEPATPSVITGAGGWTRPNKAGSVAGILFAIGGYGSATYTALKNVGDSCSTQGAVATSTTGQQLICRGSAYVTTLNALPNYREMQKVVVKDVDFVDKPQCEAGGTPAYSFEMTQTTVDVSIAPPLQSLYLGTIDYGSQWRIVIHMKDRNTTDVSANPYSITAIFHVQCYYPY